ncbi:hypothetical protein DPMN_099920 [Dreissena polymorpha]|uniref:Uncharacterized protein n=1 Tax=Dreissena polymorpha TaxID=45954 RepID=A0A9D4LGC8_DREPO|nr:hypothetical protein DPMN_099920 [Dreissena polymorpha]
MKLNCSEQKVLRRKTSPHHGNHVAHLRLQDIIGTNLLTKFHEDRKINVASRVLTRKNASPPGGHVFQPTGIIFELVQDIIGMNLLTKKNAPPLGSHVFQANTNLLTKFYEDWTINVSSRVKNAPPSGSHVFQPTGIIFELFQDIIGMNLLTKFHTNLLTKFHEDRKINLASKVLTRFYYSHKRKNAPPPGGHVFQPTGITLILVQYIIGINLLTKFLEDRTINVASREKNAPPLGSHVFLANVTIFKLIQDIIETNLLTKVHEDWTINVASREKNAPPLGSHVFQANVTIFELIQDIIETNLLTKFMKIGQ